jgi:hypothetical protein
MPGLKLQGSREREEADCTDKGASLGASETQNLRSQFRGALFC